MNFDFSDDQKMLGSSLRKFFADKCSNTLVRESYENGGWSSGLWQAMANMGLQGTAIAESHGGAGSGYLELCVVAEELGRALAPVPFGASIYCAAQLIAHAANENCTDYLSVLANGESIATYAEIDDAANPAVFKDGLLNGSKTIVPDAVIANLAIVKARSENSTVLVIVNLAAPGVSVQPLSTLDPTRSAGRIDFNNVEVKLLQSGVSTENNIQRMRNVAAVLVAFEQLGGAEAALYCARDYALERRAFGKPIGSFQALKHMLADMYAAVTLARSNCYYGASALASDFNTTGNAQLLARAAATARISATAAFQLCAANNIQIHGAMGFTWETDCHLFYRRSNALACLLGPSSVWEDQLIDAMNEEAINENAA